MAHRLFRSGSWLLLPWLLGACALPLNTAVRDWARTAGIAITQPRPTPPAHAMQEALSTYFLALGVLWDGIDLTFDDASFAALAPRLDDPQAAEAMAELGRLLRAASDEKPPRWLPADNSGPAPAYEDRRLSATIRAADAPVQLLLAALARPARAAQAPRQPAPPGDAEEAQDPGLRQALAERQAQEARIAAEARAARTRYAAVLAQVAEGHAVLAANAGRIRQRATERELRLAEDRLRRVMADPRRWIGPEGETSP